MKLERARGLQKELKRTCVICGKPLQILLNEDLSYSGGHYFFGKADGLEAEYWECDECFNKVDVDVTEDEKKCPKCKKSNFVILAGGCGQRSMMAHLCKEEDCGYRWQE